MKIFKLLSILYYIAMGMVFLGAIMQLGDVPNALMVLGGGALFMFAIRLYNQAVSSDKTKRINSILLVSSVFLLVAAYSVYDHKSYWVVFILITAMLDSYASFRRIKS